MSSHKLAQRETVSQKKNWKTVIEIDVPPLPSPLLKEKGPHALLSTHLTLISQDTQNLPVVFG